MRKDIEAVNLASGQYIDAAGNVWPITNYFDQNGDPCESHAAFSAVAGSGRDWFAVNITEFKGKPS